MTDDLAVYDIPEWGSIAQMQIITTLEDRLQLKFPVADLYKLTKVKAIKAFIVKKAGADLDFPTISAHLRTVLEPYKIPQIYEWIREIPKAKNGKTLRRLLVGR